MSEKLELERTRDPEHMPVCLCVCSSFQQGRKLSKPIGILLEYYQTDANPIFILDKIA